MENTEKLYENLITLLKNSKPHLEQAEELQKNTIKRIEYLSINKKKMNIYRFTGIISGMAACLLGILFVYETTQKQIDYPSECNVANNQIDRVGKEFMQKISFNATTNVETLKAISSIMQQKQIENKKREQFYASLLEKIN
jgi:hypothetical protein